MLNAANLAKDAATFTTNAVANTTNGPTTLVAAPGPGLRLRYWGACLISLPQQTGITRIFLRGDGGGGAADNFAVLSVAAGASPYAEHWVHGGYALPINVPLVRYDSSNAASQSPTLIVYYTEEAAA
jgi:hypothetical protein